MKSKKFTVLNEWDNNYQKEGYISSIEQLIDALKNSSIIDGLEEIVIGVWPDAYESDPGMIINTIIENKDKFQHIKSLFVGDMEYHECEISWIIQGDYEKLWAALPNLEKLTIKGGTKLKLGKIEHNNLKHLEIITGGLPKDVIASIGNAKLPNLEKLILYIGVDEYGFDGGLEDIKDLVEKLKSFKSLKYLGLLNSNLENHIVKVVIDSGITQNLEVLDFSYGTLVDIGARYILENKDKLKNIKNIILNRGYFSKEMVKTLEAFEIPVSLEELEEMEEFSDEKINDTFMNCRYPWGKTQYENLLKKYNIEKIEVENKLLDEIPADILDFILDSYFEDTYPLYTE